MIPDHFIEQLKDACPIEEVIGAYVTLKRQGRNLSGLCPFHLEKTASFVVYPSDSNPHYHCFGCGSGGDVITFVRNIENLEYIEALKFLSSRAGLTLPVGDLDDPAARMKSRVLALNREAARYFHSTLKLPSGQPGLHYLTGRGLSVATIKRFGLGFAPEGWDNLLEHLRRQGFSDQELLAAAVVSKGRSNSLYDSFRARVMFPIIDLRGNVIGFGGRALGDKGPKYLNSADTPVFRKSRNLFALNLAKTTRRDTLLLAEGYMDVISIHQAGFDNAVATLGTSLTADQARLFGQYTKKVVVAYDSDNAGQAATRRAINLLGELDISVSVLEIHDAKDPDEFIRKFGPQRFENLLSSGKGAIRFSLDQLRVGFDLTSPEDKARFLRAFCRFIAEIGNQVQRDIYIGEIAGELSVSKEILVGEVHALRKKRRLAQQKKEAHNLHVYTQDNPGMRPAQREGGTIGGFVAEEKLIALLFKNPDAYDQLPGSLSAQDFVSPENQALFDAVAKPLMEKRVPELIKLSAALSPALMAHLTRIIETHRDIQFYPGQAHEFCAAIKAQKTDRRPDDLRQITSTEEIRAFAHDLIKQKKKP